MLYSTKSGAWLLITGEPLLVLYSTISLKASNGAIQNHKRCHIALYLFNKMVLNSTSSGYLACKEPLKGLYQGLCMVVVLYSTLMTPKNHRRTIQELNRFCIW